MQGEKNKSQPLGRQVAKPAALSLKDPKSGGSCEGARQVVRGAGIVLWWESSKQVVGISRSTCPSVCSQLHLLKALW